MDSLLPVRNVSVKISDGFKVLVRIPINVVRKFDEVDFRLSTVDGDSVVNLTSFGEAVVVS